MWPKEDQTSSSCALCQAAALSERCGSDLCAVDSRCLFPNFTLGWRTWFRNPRSGFEIAGSDSAPSAIAEACTVTSALNGLSTGPAPRSCHCLPAIPVYRNADTHDSTSGGRRSSVESSSGKCSGGDSKNRHLTRSPGPDVRLSASIAFKATHVRQRSVARLDRCGGSRPGQSGISDCGRRPTPAGRRRPPAKMKRTNREANPGNLPLRLSGAGVTVRLVTTRPRRISIRLTRASTSPTARRSTRRPCSSRASPIPPPRPRRSA